MAQYYRYEDFCLCPHGGRLPAGAIPVEAPFEPLVFLVERDPLKNRGLFAICSLAELDEPEGAGLLLPPSEETIASELESWVQEHGASVVNTAFFRWFSVLTAYFARAKTNMRVNVAGMGNVGGTTALGLKLLGSDLSVIGIYDRDENLCLRYEAELNQVLPARDEEPLPNVRIVKEEELLDCDALLFTAARAVPEVGAEKGLDVRMMQYEANRELLRAYAKRARESDFVGLFCQISDPVDQLSRAVFLMSNQNEQGEFDGKGLLPEQVRGFGLGVMHARADYYARAEGVSLESLRVYGPHGNGLVIANAPNAGYDAALSRTLTHKAETANLFVRSLGYKPYLAPGLSSAAISVLRALRGEWHDAAVPLGGVYFGCRSKRGALGPEIRREKLHPELTERISESYRKLEEFNRKWAD
ncbi:MAG: lactate dehydrogenase [Eubacteriales bacterium]|nr:lactate dehydrogenase [Eubacteriales bacterium]